MQFHHVEKYLMSIFLKQNDVNKFLKRIYVRFGWFQIYSKYLDVLVIEPPKMSFQII